MKLPSLGPKTHIGAFIFYGVPCCQKMANDFNKSFLQQNKNIKLVPSHYQADTLIVAGGISHKQAPILEELWAEMISPTNVIHFIGCDRFKKSYASLDKLETLIPQTLEILACPSTR